MCLYESCNINKAGSSSLEIQVQTHHSVVAWISGWFKRLAQNECPLRPFVTMKSSACRNYAHTSTCTFIQRTIYISTLNHNTASTNKFSPHLYRAHLSEFISYATSHISILRKRQQNQCNYPKYQLNPEVPLPTHSCCVASFGFTHVNELSWILRLICELSASSFSRPKQQPFKHYLAITGPATNLFLMLQIQQLNKQLLFYSTLALWRSFTGQQEITKKHTKNLN